MPANLDISRARDLREEIDRHNLRYYVLNEPILSDFEFDQTSHQDEIFDLLRSKNMFKAKARVTYYKCSFR